MLYTVIKMPIKIERTTNPTTGKPLMKIEIDNGDLGAFDDAIKKWTFKNEESMLRFTFAVLLSSDNNKLYVDEAGKKKVLEPVDNLLKPAGEPKEEDATEPR
jgi:hypothetical protein